MKKIVYYRVINTKPYVLMQFNGISIIDINKFLCSIGFSKKQIWIYREIPYYDDEQYVPFSKLKPQHTVRKKISFDHIVSATDCIAVGDENPLLGYGLDDIIEKKIDITKETCFFAWTHDFEWTTFIYSKNIEIIIKFMAYFCDKDVRIIFSNKEDDYY